MNLRKEVVAAGAVLFLAVSACGAPRRQGPKPPPIPDEKVQEVIADKDLNGDGKLTCADSKIQRERLFKEVDADNSGGLDRDEYRSLRWHDKLYVLLELENDDLDKNGIVTLDEFEQRSNPYFNRVDKNKDCVISLDEMRADLQTLLLQQRRLVIKRRSDRDSDDRR